MGERCNHEWPPAMLPHDDCIRCGAEWGQPEAKRECPARLRAALDAAEAQVAALTARAEKAEAERNAIRAVDPLTMAYLQQRRDDLISSYRAESFSDPHGLGIPESVNVASAIRELQERLGEAYARVHRAEEERDAALRAVEALRARPVVHPLAMRVIVADSEMMSEMIRPGEVRKLRAKSAARYKTAVEWRLLGAPVWAPPHDPASACPACGGWVGVAPEVTP